MTVEEANYLGPGDWLRVLERGIDRHGLEIDPSGGAEGRYLTQFQSPKLGRLVVVELEGHGAYGFGLDEVELLPERNAVGDAGSSAV